MLGILLGYDQSYCEESDARFESIFSLLLSRIGGCVDEARTAFEFGSGRLAVENSPIGIADSVGRSGVAVTHGSVEFAAGCEFEDGVRHDSYLTEFCHPAIQFNPFVNRAAEDFQVYFMDRAG